MTNVYPIARKAPVRLSDDDEYAVYKYCIEGHGVYQIESAIEFRVEAVKLANEINLLSKPIITDGKKINSYHVRTSVEHVVAWQKRIGKLPVVPMETAELEQLRIYKTKTTRQVEELKLQEENSARLIGEYTAKISKLKDEIERLNKSGAQNKIDRIREIVSV